MLHWQGRALRHFPCHGSINDTFFQAKKQASLLFCPFTRRHHHRITAMHERSPILLFCPSARRYHQRITAMHERSPILLFYPSARHHNGSSPLCMREPKSFAFQCEGCKLCPRVTNRHTQNTHTTHTRTHIHTHARTHTYIRTHTHIYTHTYIHTHTNTNTHIYTCIRSVCAFTHKHNHRLVHCAYSVTFTCFPSAACALAAAKACAMPQT